MGDNSGDKVVSLAFLNKEVSEMNYRVSRLADIIENFEGIPEDVAKEVRSLAKHFNRIANQAINIEKVSTKEQAIDIIREVYVLHKKRIENDTVSMLSKVFGFTHDDIGLLVGMSGQAIQQRLRVYDEKLKASVIAMESSDSGERATTVLNRLYNYVMHSEVMDREVVNAAKAYVEMQSKQIERDILVKWKHIEVLSEFFFSRLLPELQMALSAEGSSVSLNPICMRIFDSGVDDLKAISESVKMMPDAIKSAIAGDGGGDDVSDSDVPDRKAALTPAPAQAPDERPKLKRGRLRKDEKVEPGIAAIARTKMSKIEKPKKERPPRKVIRGRPKKGRV